MTIETFMNQIDKVKRIQTLRNQIGEIQTELGFDDVVAEYVLQNAPDGADDKDLMELAIKYQLGPEGTFIEDASQPASQYLNLTYLEFVELVANLSNVTDDGTSISTQNDNTITEIRARVNVPYAPDWGVKILVNSELQTISSPYNFVDATASLYSNIPLLFYFDQQMVEHKTSPISNLIENVTIFGDINWGIKISGLGTTLSGFAGTPWTLSVAVGKLDGAGVFLGAH